jgi:hypothetical protein
MPTHELAFLVAHARDLTPPLVLGGQQLAPVAVTSESAAEELREELGHAGAAALGPSGEAAAVIVSVEGQDENQAIAAAYRLAKRIIEPYSLLEPDIEGINLARFRPDVLPNALTINRQVDPPTVDFRYYDRSRLARMNIGASATSVTSAFNNDVIRHICALYPKSLVDPAEDTSPIDLRIARAVHWYSQAEGLSEETLVSSAIG